jgi:DNA replication protein DnaC
VTDCTSCRNIGWLAFESPNRAARFAPCGDCETGLRVIGIPPQFHRASLSDSTSPGRQLAAWRGRMPGWLLYGGVGRGKTHLAAAICRDQAARGRSPRFLSSARLLALIKATFDAETRPEAAARLEEYEQADVVVLDDLGAEHETDWAEAELTMWVDGFYERGAALVVTTNLTIPQLTAQLGRRIASRIVGMTLPLHLTGPDRRMGLA